MTRWDLVYKWADPETQSIVDAVTSALENCDRKLTEAGAAPLYCDHGNPIGPPCAQCQSGAAPRAEGPERDHNGQPSPPWPCRLDVPHDGPCEPFGAAPRTEGLNVKRLTKAINQGLNLILGPYSEQDIERVVIEYERLDGTPDERA